MCGINVIVDKTGNVPPATIARMTGCTVHRGPDHSANLQVKSNGNTFFFGHNRLRVIDLSQNADQPIWSPNGRFLLLYNGEIYNYRELKQELREYDFKTESDTEVVLALLIKLGAPGLQKLNGMFALVLFDKENGTLLAARDRFGIKPLYYAETSHALIISSEISPIIKTGLVEKNLNEAQLHHYLRYKFAKKPNTFFSGIYELEEGSLLLSGPNGVKTDTYLSAITTSAETDFATDTAEIILKTESLLIESVQRQLAADVPVGLFLSGGTDSTLLLAILAELGHKNFPTFSVNARPEEHSFGTEDNLFAPMAASLFQADHTSLEITENLLNLLPGIITGLDQPIADSAALLTYFMSGEAKKSVTVALSGAGADELFAGYNRHWAFYKYLQHRSKFTALMPLLRTGTKMLPTGIHHPLRKQFQLIKKMAPGISASAKHTFLNFTALQPQLAQLLIAQPQTNAVLDENLNHDELLQWALHHDTHQYLISDILALTDKMSMRHSLEIRVPYLDNELADYLRHIPAGQLFKGRNKWPLKQLLTNRGGQAFANRKKEGLGLPLGAWLRKPTNTWLLKPLTNKSGFIFKYLDFDKTQKLLQAHQKSRSDFSLEIWALVVLAWWLDKEFT